MILFFVFKQEFINFVTHLIRNNMKQQSTYSFLKKSSLKIILTAFTLVTSYNGYSQLLYNNGPISTGTEHFYSGTIAPAGYTWSEMEAPDGNFNLRSYYDNALTRNYTLADDFVVPAGQTWNLTEVNVYGYQSGNLGSTIPIDVLRVRIWNGDPSLGTSSVVSGDLTTNVLNTAKSAEEFIYRTGSAVEYTRKVWHFNATISATLTAGTYWLEYQTHAIDDLIVGTPPIAIIGTQTDPAWNAKQTTLGTWATFKDVGSGYTKAIPFQLIDATLGLNSNKLASNFKMYPVPAKNVCNFKLNSNTSLQVKSANIYDLKGSLVLHQDVNKNDSDFSVNVSNLEAGMYIVKILDFEQKVIYTDKVIKE